MRKIEISDERILNSDIFDEKDGAREIRPSAGQWFEAGRSLLQGTPYVMILDRKLGLRIDKEG